jgi:WD40 repeat protein
MRSSVLVGWAMLITVASPCLANGQNVGDEELQRLAARAAKPDKIEPLRQDILALLRKYPGTAAALKAAGLLHDLPSPCDKLSAKSIPEIERFDWHPKETVAILGEHRGRQGGPVTCALFSKNGKWLASGSSNGYLRIWDSGSMRLKHTFGHTYGAYCLAGSRDSGLLAIGGGDGQVHLLDTSAEPPKDKGFHKVCSTPLFGLSLAPDTKTFACGGSDARVYVWDLTSEPPKEIVGSAAGGVVRAVVYSASGHLIAAGGDDKTLRVWTWIDQRMKEKLTLETPAGVLSLAFHPKEEKTLVSGGADGVVRVWEVGTKLILKNELKGKYGAVNAVTFSASGNSLAAAYSDGTARTWTFAGKLTERSILEGHKAAATAVAFAPDGKVVATGSSDWTVRHWPGVAGIKPRDKTIVKGHLSHVYSVAFHPDGAGLASGSYDTSVRFWDLAGAEGKEHLSKLKEDGAIYTLAFAPDGKTLAAGGAAAMFRTCEFDSGKFLFGFTGHRGNIARLAWSPDGKRLASCSNDKTVRIWDGSAGKGVGAVTAFETAVGCVAFSPDSKQLICTSGDYLRDKLGQLVVKGNDILYKDSTVRVYQADDLSEKTRWTFEKALMYCCTVTPDGRGILAGGTDSIVREWDAVKLPKQSEVVFKGSTGGVGIIACSPDGRWLATYGPNYRVELIDLATRKKVRDWAMGEQFGSLAFAPDSRHLAISVGTGIVLILRLEEPKQGA